jgi:TolB-like protein/class 3 adenylate cyclase
MAAEVKKEIQLEIAHVLFIDIVGYSKLSINDQRAAIDELNQAVRTSEQFQKAEGAGRLIKIPTGDGMALVFYKSPEEPVECALEISRALKEHPKLQLRMGVHSGPVSGVIDVNGQANLAGAGLNMAQRVMDCGDAGHILLSKRVADDLGEYEHWRPLLHDLGECEVKHGMRVSIVNLHADEVGNPQLPKKFQALKKHRARIRWATTLAALLALAAIVAGIAMVSRDRARSTLSAPEKSIAVLPFQNLSRDEENAFFADGVQDEVLGNLASVADLKVISRTSVMQYKIGVKRNLREIAQQLAVAHVVEGSVQRVGGRLRVNAQLIDARTDAHLWAQTYDRDLADVFAIQSEIAKAIADQLQAKLSPREKTTIERRPTSDVEAFDLYTRAKNMFLTIPVGNRQSVYLEAIDHLNQAVARDPSFLQAYCLLAHAHDDLYFYGIDHTPERLRQADAAVAAALRLEPDAGEAHLARAEHRYHGYHDYIGALAEIQFAARTLPNDPHVFELTGYILRRQDKWEEGMRNLARALEVDPRNLNTMQQIALTYLTLRRYPEAVAMWDRALAMQPDHVETRVWRAQAELDWKADTRRLHRTIDEIRRKDPAAIQRIANSMFLCALAEHDLTAAESALVALGNNPSGYDQMLFDPKFNEGLIARLAAEKEKARAAFTVAHEQQEKIVRAQPEYAAAICILGLIDAALGRKEEALRGGRRAIELVPVAKDRSQGANMIQYFAVIAAWVGEKDLAFEQLEKAVQLPSYTITTYGQLKLHPYWDPLRGDPRFEKIVASLAPK